jgi:hypothetical protein
MSKIIVILIALVILGRMAAGKRPPAPEPSRFAAGQKWAYQTRPGEEGSFVVVLKVERDDKDAIVHIAIEALKLKNPRAGKVSERIGHSPISEKALAASVTKRLAENVPLPDFEEGYASWKAAHGGVFTIPIAEIVATIEKSLAQ